MVNTTLDAPMRRKLAAVSNAQLICMVRGHRWPDVDLASNSAEDGITSTYNQNLGVFEQTEICERSATQRSRVLLPPGIYPTLSDGLYVPGKHWRYEYAEWWIHFTIDDEVTKAILRAEYDYRGKNKFYILPAATKRELARLRARDAQAETVTQ